MKKLVHLPTFGFVVATRALMGAGVGFLLSNWMGAGRQKRVGTALLAIGVATTVPALIAVLRGRRRAEQLKLPMGAAV